MEKKIFALLFLGMILLSVSSVSALELNPFANSKTFVPELKEDMSDFLKEDFNSKYGVIQLSKTMLWFETDRIAEYSLTENTDQCLINCESKGKAVLYKDGKLFDDKYFLNKKGVEVEIDSQYYIKEIETYYEDVPQYKKVCSMQKIISNNTLLKGKNLEEEVCNQEVVGYDKVEKTKEVWNEYNFETLPAGEYEWKIIGSKATSQAVDFIPIAHGKSLNEWSWWNNDWKYKKEILIQENSANTLNNYSVELFVEYSSNMNNDFSDLRFVNSAEDEELGYWIESKNDGVNATIWVKVPELTASQNTSIYMYYGNSEASSESSSLASPIIFSDDFNIYNSSIWQGTNWGVSDGKLQYNGGAGTNQKLKSYSLFNITNIEYNVNMIEQNTIYWGNAGMTPTNADNNMYPGGIYILLKFDSNLIYYNAETNQATEAENTNWNNYTIKKFGNNVSFYRNNVLKANWANVELQNSAVLWFGSREDTNFKVEEVSLRQYVPIIPTYTIGAEEQLEGVSVTLNSPADELQSTSSTINFNATITPRKADIKNVTLYLNDEEYLDLYDTNETINYSKILSLDDGNYTWNITACWIGVSEEESCTESATRTFSIDSVAPNLTLNAPLTNFTTLTLPINVTLNFTASDSNLGSCWFSSSINSTNTTFTCNTTQTRAFNSSGWHSFTYYANDTFGGVSTGTAQFYIYYVQPSATATNPITEGGISSHSFYLNMTNVANFNATAELFWNGTSYGLGTKTTLSNDSLRFDKNIIVPSINGTSVNWTWVYNISGNPNVTNYNLTGSQNYIKVNITECGAGTYQILNYTLYDQETRALGSTANASIEVDLTLTSQANDSLSWQYHATKTSSTSFLICLPSGALNNSAYDLDSVSKYTYQDHVLQYHYIENFNLTKSSIPQTIKLYPLATAKSTSFLVNYQDENYIYVENAVIDVWRRYIGDGVFFSVEHGKTDANGQTRLHLVTEDIIYKFLVWQDGELVYTSPEFLALCQATPCQINLRQSTDETDGFSERDNLIYDYDFNKTTRTASFTFATKDNTQTEINMTILSSNQYANETACTTSLTTSGGQIDCVIPTAFTNTSYQTIIYQDGQYFGTAFDSLAPSSMEIFGYTGLILTAIAYLMLALMGISSGIATIIFGIIGLVFMGIIQIFESGNVFGMASAIIWLIVAGIIIIIKITKRRIQ